MIVAGLNLPKVRSFRFVTPNAPDAPKRARDHVVWLLHHAGDPVPVEVARLLVSEVVTNAHQHAAPPLISLTTTFRPSRLHVDVYDTNPLPPPRVTYEGSTHLTADDGRGLLMLDLLASRWGWEVYGRERPVGKSVWFELLAEQAEPC